MRYIHAGGRVEIDLATASHAELMLAQDRISDFRGRIQAKLDDANAARLTGEGRADPRDWARWKNIRRTQGGQLRKLNMALSRIAQERKAERRRHSAEQNAEFGQCFIDCAKQMLDEHTLGDITVAARALREQRERGL